MPVSLDDIEAEIARRAGSGGVSIEDIDAEIARRRGGGRQQEQNPGSLFDTITNAAALGFGPQLEGFEAGIGSLLSGGSYSEGYERGRDAFSQGLENFETANPKTATAANIGGGLLSPVPLGKTRAARTAFGTAAGAAANVGAGQGETLTENLQDAATGAATGLLGAGAGEALGAGLKATAGRYLGGPGLDRVTPDVESLGSPTYQRQIDILKREGVDALTPGQKSGNTGQLLEETTLAPTRFGASIEQKMTTSRKQAQRALMQKAGFRASDANAGEISREALSNASQRFNNRYDDFFNRIGKVDLDDPGYIGRLRGLEKDYLSRLSVEQRPALKSALSEAQELAKKGIDGRRFKQIRNELARRARNASDFETSNMFYKVIDTIDGEIEARVGRQAAKSFQKIRKDYKNFAAIRSAMKAGGPEPSRGLAPIASLNRAGQEIGTSDFGKLTNAMSAVLSATPNSGTASRSLGAIRGTARRGALGVAATGQAAGLPRAINRDPTLGLSQRLPAAGLLALPDEEREELRGLLQ